MAEDKKSFLLYTDLLPVIEKLVLKDRIDNTNYGGELFYLVLQYVNDLNPAPLDFLLEISFEHIKTQLKRDLKKYESIKEKKSEAGKASAAAKAAKKVFDESELTKSTDVESVEQNQHKATHSTVSGSGSGSGSVSESVSGILPTNQPMVGRLGEKEGFLTPPQQEVYDILKKGYDDFDVGFLKAQARKYISVYDTYTTKEKRRVLNWGDKMTKAEEIKWFETRDDTPRAKTAKLKNETNLCKLLNPAK